MTMLARCHWCGTDPLYLAYHDHEWGVPVWDDLQLFEFLILEGMQAGLSWITILRKRAHYRLAFDGFNPETIARFDQKKIAALMHDPGIVRHAGKISAVVSNAQCYLTLRETTSLSDFLWQFTDHRVITHFFERPQEVPTSLPESVMMAKALKKKGFRFVGETICYAFMQAVGMVNDHWVGCYRHKEIMSLF